MNTQSAASTSYGEDFGSNGDEGRSDENDVIGHALNLDDLEMKFTKNGIDEATYSISAASAAIGYVPSFYDFSDSGADTSEAYFNFGQDSSFGARYGPANGKTDGNDEGDFVYEPPSGHLAMCTNNLTDSAVTAGQHFNTILYTGDDSADRAITGVGFAPDLVWVKELNNTAHHVLVDSVRGAAGGRLSSNRNNAEDNGSGVAVGSFDSDGFTTGSSYSFINGSTPLIAFCWKANGSGSSNTNGSINTTATSANTSAGFSISTYTGTGSNATIGHGLSKAPEWIIVKRRNAAEGWATYHSGIASDAQTDFVELHSTAAASDSDTRWNDTAPTTSVFSIGTHDSVNASSSTYVSYAWHSVEGYSKIGSYIGNGNAAGTFVYTGFKPAWVLIKPSSRTGHWFMANNKSSPSNDVDKVILANDSAGEYTDPNADCKKDFLSNGFRIRTADDNTNEDGSTYIFIAFAETQQKYSNAR